MNLPIRLFSLMLFFTVLSCSETPIDAPKSNIKAETNLTQPVQSNGITSFDLTNDITLSDDVNPIYTWYFGDGSESVVTTEPVVNHVFTQNDIFNVTLIVSDSNNNAEPITLNLDVNITHHIDPENNNDPVSSFDAQINQTTIILDSTSTDLDGDTLTYKWKINGNLVSILSSDTFSANTSGLFSIELEVTDIHGATDISYGQVTIENQAPAAHFSITALAKTISVNAQMTTDFENDQLNYSWNFGDSNTDVGVNAEHTYAQVGTYTVVLTVSDSFNSVDFEREIEITLDENSAPTAEFVYSVDPINKQRYTFDASTSFDINGDDITYAWDFGNGQTSTDMQSTQIFDAGFDYTVSLTVSDNQMEHSKSVLITIAAIVIDPDPNPELQFSDYTTDVERGRELYDLHNCADCHQSYDTDLYKTHLENLFTIIDDGMPLGNAGACVGQCAADITAFIDEVMLIEIGSCSEEDPVLYGQRALRLLTQYEYTNTINDLFGTTVPAEYIETIGDVNIASFPNNYNAVVTGGVNDQYYSNAEAIADWAMSQGLPFSCDEAQTCATQFVTEFAPMAFRRPLRENGTDTEISDFTALISNAPTTDLGLRWALVATLISPEFLYRSEQGVLVSTAKSEGWGIEISDPDGSGNVNDYLAIAPSETVLGQDFATKSTGGAENEDGTGGHNIWTTGSISQSFNFTSPAIVEITIRGSIQNSQGPNMILSAGGVEVITTDIQNEEYQTYKYLVSGLTGANDLTIEFTNDETPSATEDRNLYVLDATVSSAQLVETIPEPVVVPTSLDLADDNAFVLDPYEYATVLSYMYTGSTPDALLMQAAANGDLESQELVLEQIDRMMNSDAGEAHFKEFVRTWMQTNKLIDPGLTRNNPDFNDDVKQSMVGEVESLFWHIFNNEDVPFSDFYQADYTFVNDVLADYYSIVSGAQNEFVKVDTSTRGGIITSGAFMATFAHPDQTSPIIRAVRVRELMLCHHIDAPPALPSKREELAAQVEILKNNGDLTTRGYYEKITDDGVCADCHDEDINPLGGGMEDFDQAGLPRTHQFDVGFYENEVAINAAGTLFGTDKLKDTNSIDFYGAKELSNIVGDLDASQACLVEKAFRFSTSRAISTLAMDKISRADKDLTLEEEEDFQCANDLLLAEFIDSNESPKALFRKMGILDLVRFRR